MNCNQVQDLLLFYAEKSLEQEKMKEVSDHLLSCQTCRHLASRFEETESLLNERKHITANPYLYTRIMQRLENEGIRHNRNTIPALLRNAVLVSLSVTAGILLGINLLQHTSWTGAASASPQASALQQESIFWYGDIDDAGFETYFETNNQVQP